MVDAPALGAGGSNPVEVQVLSPAPKRLCPNGMQTFWYQNKQQRQLLGVAEGLTGFCISL